MFFRSGVRAEIHALRRHVKNLQHTVYGLDLCDVRVGPSLETQCIQTNARITRLLNHLGLEEVSDPAQTRIVPKEGR